MKAKPFRYKAVAKPIGFWQSLAGWIRTGDWLKTKVDYVVVLPESPEYDTAPFEAAVVFHRAFETPEATVITKR